LARSGHHLRPAPITSRRVWCAPFGVSLTFLLVIQSAPLAPAALRAAPTASQPATIVQAQELDRTIDRVLERREYAWRLPRRVSPEAKQGWFASWVEAIFKALRGFWEALAYAWEKLIEWLTGSRARTSKDPSLVSVPAVQTVVYVLLAIAAVLLGWMAWSRRRLGREKIVTAEAHEALPDLHSDNVSADELPEDRWLQMARELVQRGDLRLALRASYLAVLAHLGQRKLLGIARHKSNLDYRRELARRAAQRRELLAAFEENVSAFERAWYGRSLVTPEVMDRFSANLEAIRAR
jgi:hypothetical protein